MPAVEPRTRIIGFRDAIPSGGQRRVGAKIILPRCRADPGRIEMPGNPVRRAFVAVIADDILRLRQQVIERLIDIGDGIRRIAQNQMLVRIGGTENG